MLVTRTIPRGDGLNDSITPKNNITRKTVYNWMAHGSIPQSKLVMMSELFHCSIDYLLEREPKA